MSPDVRAAIRSMSRDEQLELLDERWALRLAIAWYEEQREGLGGVRFSVT